MSAQDQEGMKCDLKHNLDKKMSRRDFLGFSALWSCIAAWVLTFIGLGKFPLPALLPDVSNVFKIVSHHPSGGHKTRLGLICPFEIFRATPFGVNRTLL